MGEPPPMPRGEELTTHGRFLRALARSLVAPADQEDVVQEAWTRALAHPPRHDSALKAWLARILRRTAHAHGGREAERGEREATAYFARPERASDDPAAIAAELELSRRLLESVERLREPYRTTLYLRYYRGHAPERIAAESGTPVKTIKTRLARGLEELRGELDRLHGGERQAWVALLLPLTRSMPPEPLETLPPARVGPGALVGGGALLVAGSAAVVLFLLEGGTDPRPERANARPEDVPLAESVLRDEPPSSAARIALETSSGPALARDDRIRLHGRVLDALGAPLVGVEVRITPLAREFRGPRGFALDAAEVSELALTTSAPDGGFELVLLEPGLIRVGCERDGFAAFGRRLQVFAGQELDLGPLVLEPGARLAGRVRDEDGRALAGAELWMPRRDEGLRFWPEEIWFRVATSDARGDFTLARVPVGDWRLEARAGDYRPSSAEGTCGLDDLDHESLELVLARGAALAGTVQGLAAEELGAARVLARQVQGRGPPRSVAPDAGGHFRLGGFAPEEELELVLLRAGAREPQRGAKSQRARAGQEDLVLVAEPWDADQHRARESSSAASERGALLATVTSEDGAPRPGALVLLLAPARGRDGSEVRAADRDGRVYFDELAPGEHGLVVVSGVFDPRLESAAGASFVSVAAGETTHTTLRALSLGRLAGEVRVQGRTLAGAEVSVRPIGNEDARRGPPPSLVAKSDGGGRFAFVELLPGEYALELVHRSLAAPHRRTLELRAGPNELRLALATGELAARVLDERGQPLAGVRVLAAVTGERYEPPEAEAALATSDARGEFVLAGIDFDAPPELRLEAPGYATRRVVLAPSAPNVFQLEPEAALALTIRGGRGPRLRLVAHGPDGAERVFGLVPEERALLHGLAPGRWSFTVHGPARSRAPAPLLERTLELLAGEPLELTFELP